MSDPHHDPHPKPLDPVARASALAAFGVLVRRGFISAPAAAEAKRVFELTIDQIDDPHAKQAQ